MSWLPEDDDGATEEKYYDLINSAPFKMCDMTTEPTGYLETALGEVLQPSATGNFNYTCWSGFNATTDAVPTAVDEACVHSISEVPLGVRSCPGEPHHEDFFKKTPYNYPYSKTGFIYPSFQYVHRHHVLFNLYAFDSYNSNRTHAPTLNLVNCDFTYFFDKQALI